MEIFKFISIISLSVAAVFGIVTTLLYPRGKNSSVSQSLGRSNKSFVVSASILSVLSIGFCSGLALWYAPIYGLSVLGYSLTVLILISLIGLAWTRAKQPGDKRKFNIHFGFGQILGVSLLGLLLNITLSSQLQPYVGAILWLTIVFCASCYPLYIFVPHVRKHFLSFEIIFSGLIIVSYLLLAIVGS